MPLPEFSLASPVRVCDKCGEARLKKAKAWRYHHRMDIARRRAQANIRRSASERERERRGGGNADGAENDDDDGWSRICGEHTYCRGWSDFESCRMGDQVKSWSRMDDQVRG